MAKKDKNIISAILVAAVLITGGLIYLGTRLGGGSLDSSIEQGIQDYVAKQQAAAQPTPPPARTDVSVDDDAVKGDKNAPVTIVEFSDYECPFCGRFFAETLPQIDEKYIKTGKVKLIYRDFPLSFHPSAKPAALAAECARDQGGDKAYFSYHDQVFANQASLSVASLKQWAVDLGLDEGQFNECLDSEKYADEINKDFIDGQSYGVRGTPAFFINGQLISGAQPFAVFEQVIEAQLQ